MISLKKADYEKILAHAKSCVPEEACGLIAGTKEGEDKVVEKVYLLTNIDHSNEHFTLDPKEQLAAVKDMRANGLIPLGNWHSHPESPSRPSEEDKRLAYDSSLCGRLSEPQIRGAGRRKAAGKRSFFLCSL